MDLINNLSEGLVEKFKDKQKNKLQQTFVTASVAEEAKAEGIHLFVLKIKYNISILLKVAIKSN